jgi:hypothetical protein
MTTATETRTTVLSEVQALNLPDMGTMTRNADSALRMATTFVIGCDDDYALAAEELQGINGRINRMEAARTAITGPINKALQAVNDLFRSPMGTLQAARDGIKKSMLAYHDEKQRQIAREREIAEAAAALERKKLADEIRRVEQEREAEIARIAQEAAQAHAQAVTAAADLSGASAETANMQAELALQHAQMRQQEVRAQSHEATAALQLVSAVMSAPVSTIELPKGAGTSVRKTVDYEVSSLLALVQHIAANPTLINLLIVDSVKLRSYVRGLGVNTNLPGVRVYEKRNMSAKSA